MELDPLCLHAKFVQLGLDTVASLEVELTEEQTKYLDPYVPQGVVGFA